MPQHDFEEGDRVILLPTSDYYGSTNNPIWGGEYGKIVGTIIGEAAFNHTHPITVKWDNGYTNVYKPTDIIKAHFMKNYEPMPCKLKSVAGTIRLIANDGFLIKVFYKEKGTRYRVKEYIMRNLSWIKITNLNDMDINL